MHAPLCAKGKAMSVDLTDLDTIASRIDRAVEAAHVEKRRTYIGASVLGDPCEAKLWYSFRWAHAPETHEGRMLRLFETGHVEEARMIGWLRLAGCEVIDRNEDGTQLSTVFAIGHGGGHADGVVTGLPEAPKTAHLLECKTHNAKSFAQLVKTGVAVAKPEHMAQMQVYMHRFGLTRALYLAKCKDDDRLHAERVEYDASHANALMAKADRLVAAEDVPARMYDGYYGCGWCPAKGVCRDGEPALRNCRTCLHATPYDGGEWACKRHNRHLSRDDQERGCPHHLYLPALVAGEAVDADETAETVTYQMRDGTTWTDGEGRVQ
jgi:hypothetical protein